MHPVQAPSWQVALCALVEQRIGIRLRMAESIGALEPFVQARMRALSLPSPASYVNFLRAEATEGTEFSRLTAVCTNGQTSFFRDLEQLQAVVQVATQLGSVVDRPLTIWSAGCSTGEEPYSLAILMQEAGVRVQILATDINTDQLRVAEEGIYSAWSLRHVPEATRVRCFVRHDERFVVQNRLRTAVTFRRQNLVDGEIPPTDAATLDWDIILCRNVFIYYARPTMESILQRMAARLSPQGWLFLSASEGLHDIQVPLTAVPVASRFGYQRHASLAPGASLKTSQPSTPEAAVNDLPTARPTRHADLSGPHRVLASQRTAYHDAVHLIDQGNIEAAREALLHVLNAEPSDTVAWISLGHLYLSAHDFEHALECYNEAQANAPLSAESHYFLGVLYRKVGSLEQAEQALRQALFLEPEFWPASFMLAGIYERQARPSFSRRELLHTQKLLQPSKSATPFRSHVATHQGLNLLPSEVLAACQQRLSAPHSSRA